MLLTDDSGITSFIRILFLDPKTYDNLLKFFNAQSYSLNKITSQWLSIIESSPQALLFENRGILIGDHTKVAKEGRRMPAVKAHHQESEDLGKPATIYGHHFGMVGILIGRGKQNLCTPLQLRIHEGAEQISFWKNRIPMGRNERLIREGLQISSSSSRDNYLLLDRDFMNKNGIRAILEHNASACNKLDLVGRCKSNVTCRRKLTQTEKEILKKEKRPGRPREYTKPVKPFTWFDEFKDEFKSIQLSDGCVIKLFSRIEYWHGMKLKFVLEVDQNRKLIYYSTDLNLRALKVVQLYKMRFNIEITFFGLKHIVHGFSYHFWVKDFEKLTKFSKDRLKRASDNLKPKIIKCVERIERSVNFAGIALGVIQFMALSVGQELSPREIRYQRTYRHEDCISVEQFQHLFGAFLPFYLLKIRIV